MASPGEIVWAFFVADLEGLLERLPQLYAVPYHRTSILGSWLIAARSVAVTLPLFLFLAGGALAALYLGQLPTWLHALAAAGGAYAPFLVRDFLAQRKDAKVWRDQTTGDAR